jgi:hypothetical protein
MGHLIAAKKKGFADVPRVGLCGHSLLVPLMMYISDSGTNSLVGGSPAFPAKMPHVRSSSSGN